MNRFFSKLDLRDIKIDPNSSRFPPDAEEEPEEEIDAVDAAAAAATEPSAEPAPSQQGRTGYVPSWAQPGRSAQASAPPSGSAGLVSTSAAEYAPSKSDVRSGNETTRELAPVDPHDAFDTAPSVVQAEEIATEVASSADASGYAPGHTVASTNHSFDTESVSTGPVEVLKVSARSRPSAVAGAIAGVVRESGRAEVQAIGAGATNQAVKAVAIARDYLRETGIEAVCLPAFIDVTIENEDRTAIRLVVEPR